MKYYTGVGSRSAPDDILQVMEHLAQYLKKYNYTLRSGGAQGADKAFEKGAYPDKTEIYYANDATEEAMKIAAKYHPGWQYCKPFVKQLHGRNVFQVLGKDLETPSTFLVCWTPDGCISHKERTRSTGGTGTAISIADVYGVKIFNLQRDKHLERIKKSLYPRTN